MNDNPEAQARYELVSNDIEFQIAARIGTKGERPLVIFSAYEMDADDVPINNLNDVAFQGRVQFRQARSEYWGGPQGRDWKSPVLENPTWLDLCVQANAMIPVTNDRHHVFLEEIEVVGTEGDIAVAAFRMGS